MPEQQFPEPTVGALIINAEGKLFLMRSHKWRDGWVVPGGHIELGERMDEALRREVKEETGLEIYDIQFLLYQEFVYDEAFWERRHFIFFDYQCRTDMEEARLNSEAQEYQWVTAEKAFDLPMDAYTKRVIEKYLERRSLTGGSSPEPSHR
jgi:nucleoside triphosphatase